MTASNEAITIIVTARDRFSQTEACVENLIAHTPHPYHLIVVLGGAAKEFESKLRERYEKTARLLFEPQFLNCCEARNLALRLATTRLSVCMDNDIFVRPGWLPPLIRCQNETGAGLVVPLILEDDTRIHCAGNEMFITKKGGRAFVHKVLPYFSHQVYEGTNLKRRELDYGEMHLQLVETKTTLELGIYDERIQEGQELDVGLSWRKAGRSIWFEPESIVVYDFPRRIEHPGDVAFFCWRWNAANLIRGYKVMHEKWGMDMTEDGSFKYFLRNINAKVGWISRLWPSWTALAIDRAIGAVFSFLPGTAERIRQSLSGWGSGYYQWVVELEGGQHPLHRLGARISRSLKRLIGRRREPERVEVQEGIHLEVFPVEDHTARGSGASLFAKGEEVLRIACLGHGRGHYQVFPSHLKRWEISRYYFKEETVDAQIEAAIRLLERETQARLRASPVLALREVALDPVRMEQACEGLSQKLYAYAR